MGAREVRANPQSTRPERGKRMEQRGRKEREWRRETRALWCGEVRESMW